MSVPLDLLVGLGNPGSRYAHTRHNAGFWFADRVAARHGGSFRRHSRFHGEVCETEVAGRRLRVLKPDTYMNHSGVAVAALVGFYRYDLEAILIAHDEIDLPPGTARLKLGGGHGGHNGLRDVIPKLGGNGFVRLRIGVGHPGSAEAVVGYVLKSPPAEERVRVVDAVEQALDLFPLVVAGEAEKVMNALHRKEPAPPGT